jgi:uncharacterized protein YdhG (YjbR/CyaY superfamily)
MPMRGIPVAKDVEHWLARLEPEQRAALEKLRAQIRKAAPGAEEVISYGQPAFKLHGHLVAYGAFKKHLSFFPMSSTLIQKFPEAAPFAASSGTMQFQPGKPIPASLVTKMVKARIAQNLEIADERTAAKATKKAAAKPRPKSKATPQR